jgi:hypothetical protein
MYTCTVKPNCILKINNALTIHVLRHWAHHLPSCWCRNQRAGSKKTVQILFYFQMLNYTFQSYKRITIISVENNFLKVKEYVT